MKQAMREYSNQGNKYPSGIILRKDPTDWLAKNGSPPVRRLIYKDIYRNNYGAERFLISIDSYPEARSIFSRQLSSGGWGKDGDMSPRDGSLYGTGGVQVLDYLSDMGFTIEHPGIARAVDYLMQFRTSDGRFFWKQREVRAGKGEFGCYWGVMYEGYMLKILCRFGVNEDIWIPIINRLVDAQQEDGCWVLRYRHNNQPFVNRNAIDSTGERITATTIALSGLLETGGVEKSILDKGCEYLLRNLFNYSHGINPGKQALTEWYYAFRYPEFYASVLKSLVIARRAGIKEDNAHMVAGLQWLLTKQGNDGFWRTKIPLSQQRSYNQLKKNDEWITLQALLALKGF